MSLYALRRCTFALLCVVCGCLGVAPEPGVAQTAPGADLRAVIDSVIRVVMEREGVPGVSFALVENGRVTYVQGYGRANLQGSTPVSGETTLFRIGSISKAITAAALVQLADRGRLDMNVDVDRYTDSLEVPPGEGGPITAEHLLSHTAGLDEIRPGTQAGSADSVLGLADFLRTRLKRVRPTGETISYSTYSITLAGLLIEDISGLPFEEYLRNHLFSPLGMRRTNIEVPRSLAGDVATGYTRMRDSSLVAQAWEWYHTTPASSVNSTAGDMARLMTELLADQPTIMSRRALTYLQRQHATGHPRLPGFALGLYEDFVGSVRVLEHSGDMAGYSSMMVLVPDQRFGFFVVANLEHSAVRDELRAALLERAFPSARTRLPVPSPPYRLSQPPSFYTGRWAWTTGCYSCSPARVSSVMNITVNADNTLNFAGNRWVEAEPLLFVRHDGTGYIAFRMESSAPPLLFAGGFWSFQKLP